MLSGGVPAGHEAAAACAVACGEMNKTDRAVLFSFLRKLKLGERRQTVEKLLPMLVPSGNQAIKDHVYESLGLLITIDVTADGAVAQTNDCGAAEPREPHRRGT